MRLAPSLDHIVIFTGDGDFRALVAALQLSGKRVSVVSTLQTQPAMVADELRRQADQFIDLAELEAHICRDPAVRAARLENAVERIVERPERPEAPVRPVVERREIPARTTRRTVVASQLPAASSIDGPDEADDLKK